MTDLLNKADKNWLNEVLETIGVNGLDVADVTAEGFKLKYDPNLLTAHQAQELISITERDGRFTDYGLDVDNNVIYFVK